MTVIESEGAEWTTLPFDHDPAESQRVVDRLVRIFDTVRLPPGVAMTEVGECSFEFDVACWQVPWLDGLPGEGEETTSAVSWPTDWTSELWEAAADPDVDDRTVARMAVAEVAAAAAASVMHEFTEWAQLDNRRLWNAHTGAANPVSRHGARALIRQVQLGGWPAEEDG
jgi:hypothetical protein